MRLRVASTAVLAGLALSAQSAHAIDTIRVGKPAIAWTFTPFDVGLETGIFAKHGLKLEITTFGGDAKVQQALAANGVDLAVGSGPGMGFAVKGVPAKAVAAIAGPPEALARSLRLRAFLGSLTSSRLPNERAYCSDAHGGSGAEEIFP
jgi:ABC-type nitrate/sulfonate/bicarbonate transport system substrate-binding protein